MEEIEQDRKGLMDKTQDELTVKDNLKMTAIVVATFIAIPVVISGASAAVTGLMNYRAARKAERKLNIVETTAEEI